MGRERRIGLLAVESGLAGGLHSSWRGPLDGETGGAGQTKKSQWASGRSEHMNRLHVPVAKAIDGKAKTKQTSMVRR